MGCRLNAWIVLLGLASVPAAAVTETAAVQDEEFFEPEFASPTTFDRVGRIVAPVLINGLGPFRLVVDTGANSTTLTTSLADKLGIDYLNADTVILNGVTGSSVVPRVHIDSIELGALTLKEQPVMIVTPEVMANADGILGVAGLRDKQLVVDFKRDEVSIHRSRQVSSKYISIRARRVAGGLLVAPARLGGVRTLVVIDTGAESTLGNRALQRALRSSDEKRHTVSVLGTTPHIATGDVVRVEDFLLGGARVSNARVIFGDFHVFSVWELTDQPALILGMDIIGTVDTLVIDFRLRRISIGNDI